MRAAFAHEAVLDLAEGADPRAPGAAITVALCGHWEHEPPCPLAPHHVAASREGGRLRVRVLFAAEPGTEAEVRRRIGLALAGQWPLPDGLTADWRLCGSQPAEIGPGEAGHAAELVRR
jgi:hypothetical protein